MNTRTTGLAGLGPRRKGEGYTQETFADALGVKRSLLAAWEVGRVWPSSRWLPEMAALLRCSIDQLFRPPEDGIILAQEGDANHAGDMPESVL